MLVNRTMMHIARSCRRGVHYHRSLEERRRLRDYIYTSALRLRGIP